MAIVKDCNTKKNDQALEKHNLSIKIKITVKPKKYSHLGS